MHKYISKLRWLVGGACLLPMLALAQSSSSAGAVLAPGTPIGEPTSIDQAVSLIPVILTALKAGQWLLVGAVLTLILVFVFKQYVLPKLKWFTTDAIPVVSAVLGLFVGSAVSIAGGATVLQACLACLSGPLASTLWQAVAKYFMPVAPKSIQPVNSK